MAKGFGGQHKGHLGYVLVLSPDAERYAADVNLDYGQEGEYIGITNSLELAQVWKKKSQVRNAVTDYAGFWIEQLKHNSLAELRIKSVKRLPNGKLLTELEEELAIEPETSKDLKKMLKAIEDKEKNSEAALSD